MLDILGTDAIYWDTDSVHYIDSGLNKVKTGCMLGEWTDELKNHHITEEVCTGPKSYAYIIDRCGKNNCKTCTKNEICKIKGFTLSHENSKFLNLKAMNKLIDRELKIITLVDESKIVKIAKNSII